MDQQAHIIALETLVISLIKENAVSPDFRWEAVFENAHRSLAEKHKSNGSLEQALATNFLKKLKQQMTP
ncbi:hypothetical protein [Pseudomonas syringae]|uniref:Uncharacterized protein n=2 Tax=Pseudomonas syringae TaxID=317 RepID=A0A656JIN0_PSESF|nr:hypothetical protein [Pseudomonas syringae]EPN29888.1 hypothetical protein A245_46418 [Pseudomonas syringae pv. actinidiae ICMP 19096]EPM44611.1 hypothetical protein A246_22244 [Pseudomonas syringae pv. actinidiae ICMP 19098]EPM57338.1 hypothetical protein A256_05061 [Pseudomonas syringae pv. actinidiae ICMP 19103]EPM64975.1 hypothetical protein A249_41891 [Pseudomonas syringae pv. actinidiae ICMP 18804]EPN05841.1 hypothetical protein A253_05236 [Pseudomonas syringae pv. actinidiae ICMP 191